MLASCHSDSDTEVTALKVTPYAYYPETDKNKNLTKAIGLYLESPIVTQGDNDDALLDDIRTIDIQGHDAAKLSENGSSYCISSFQNNPGSAEIALGKTAYNFYAAGSAPNYFAGVTRVGGLESYSQQPGYGNTDTGFVAAAFADKSKGTVLYISRADGICSSFNSNTVGTLMDFRSNGTQAGFLSLTADTGILLTSNSATGPVIVQNSDARVKTLTAVLR